MWRCFDADLLKEAGASSAEVIISVTDDDELIYLHLY